MNKRWQNGFFLSGLGVLVVMVTQLDFAQTWNGLQRAGYWAVAVIGLWAFLYLFNTAAWWLIIRSQRPATPDSYVAGDGESSATPFSFGWLYRVTVSGFALNYATPGGLMGGEPYKMMMLKEKIGTERATASVILHTMTHIFSHFWFWLGAVVLYVLTQPVTLLMALMLLAITVFCLVAIWFFLCGYRRGITVWAMKLLGHLPLVARWAEPFMECHAERLASIDRQIAALHNQNRYTFVAAV